jgi:hypothetical protein
MTSRHLSDLELVDRLYGLIEEPEHLRECAACAERWEVLREHKAHLTAEPAVSVEFLAAQRARIRARLEQPARWGYRWASAAAAACLLVAGLFVYSPTPKPPVAPRPAQAQAGAEQPSDAQLFAIVTSIEDTMEPRAAAPIHALFEEQE